MLDWEYVAAPSEGLQVSQALVNKRGKEGAGD